MKNYICVNRRFACCDNCVSLFSLCVELEALNKADRAKIGGQVEPADAIIISAKDGTGLDKLKNEISKRIAALRHRVELLIPYDKGAVLSLLHEKGQIESEEYTESGIRILCLMDAMLHARVKKLLGQESKC